MELRATSRNHLVNEKLSHEVISNFRGIFRKFNEIQGVQRHRSGSKDIGVISIKHSIPYRNN